MTHVINTFHNSIRRPGSVVSSSQDVEAACSIFSLVMIRSYIIVLPYISCRERSILVTRKKRITRTNTSATHFCKTRVFLYSVSIPIRRSISSFWRIPEEIKESSGWDRVDWNLINCISKRGLGASEQRGNSYAYLVVSLCVCVTWVYLIFQCL
jgi:hypothetical protein